MPATPCPPPAMRWLGRPMRPAPGLQRQRRLPPQWACARGSSALRPSRCPRQQSPSRQMPHCRLRPSSHRRWANPPFRTTPFLPLHQVPTPVSAPTSSHSDASRSSGRRHASSPGPAGRRTLAPRHSPLNMRQYGRFDSTAASTLRPLHPPTHPLDLHNKPHSFLRLPANSRPCTAAEACSPTLTFFFRSCYPVGAPTPGLRLPACPPRTASSMHPETVVFATVGAAPPGQRMPSSVSPRHPPSPSRRCSRLPDPLERRHARRRPPSRGRQAHAPRTASTAETAPA